MSASDKEWVAMNTFAYRRIGSAVSLFIALIGVYSEAQTALTGHVTNASSNAGIPAATIELRRGNRTIASTTTDNAGTYSLQVTKPGKYTVRVFASPYTTQ